MELKYQAIVMANARRLLGRPSMTNWHLYSEIFGTGAGTAKTQCRQLGLDIDSNQTSYQLMCDHIERRKIIKNEYIN